MNTSSNGPFSIAMLVYQRVIFGIFTYIWLICMVTVNVGIYNSYGKHYWIQLVTLRRSGVPSIHAAGSSVFNLCGSADATRNPIQGWLVGLGFSPPGWSLSNVRNSSGDSDLGDKWKLLHISLGLNVDSDSDDVFFLWCQFESWKH